MKEKFNLELFQYFFKLITLILLFNFNQTPGQLTQITDHTADDSDSFWSPDGLELVFLSNRGGNYELWKIPAGGGDATQITNSLEHAMHPCWSPVDSMIAYAVFNSGSQNLWKVSSSGGIPTQITSHSLRDESLSWNNIGTKIIFDSDRSGNWNIWEVNTDGSSPSPIVTHPSVDVDPTVSPDGLIAFRSYRTGYSDIWVSNSSGGNLLNITNDIYEEYSPNWSYTRDHIVYSSNRSGNFDIWIISPDGGEPTQITTDPGEDWYPHWSPDGKKIAFTSNRSGNRDIWVIDVSSLMNIDDENEVIQLSFELFQNYPNPFNPNTVIMYNLAESSNVVLKIFDIRGREVKTLISGYQSIGKYSVEWDGTNNSGAIVNSGVYLYQIQIGRIVLNKKLVFLK